MFEFISTMPFFAEPMATEILHATLAFLILGLVIALIKLCTK